MMPIEIKKTYFVSPVEAFQIVGEESFGPDWKADCINDPSSPKRRIVLRNLRAALQSGQVSAFWHDYVHQRVLTPIDAADEYFRINLRDDCVHLSAFASKPVECGIREDELRYFIRTEGGKSTKLTVGAENFCFQWLLNMMTEGRNIPTTELLWKAAEREFSGLSRAAYRRARKRAIEQSGRTDIAKAGRRSAAKIKSIT